MLKTGLAKPLDYRQPAASVTPPLKRAIDVAGALAGLIVLSPALLVVAAIIRMDSAGSPLYSQTRVGLSGRRFKMFKFRTMRCDSDTAVHEKYVQSLIVSGAGADRRNDSGAFKLDDDPRITRVGAWLRKNSIDELPQLLNVLVGDMSLVGPRPPLPYEVELYTPRHRRRLDVVPGMTGLWQVSGRNRTTFEEMIDLDLLYIENRSTMLDLTILLKTVRALQDGG